MEYLVSLTAVLKLFANEIIAQQLVTGQLSGGLPALEYWPISTYPESWPDLGKVWISNCVSGHEHCKQPVQVSLPSRVVEIVDAESVRVVSGANKPDDFYVALSYCWGGPQEFVLTEDTVAEKQDSFEITRLPATLRDAVTVTKALDIKYIWIDSLCIIQDSTEDKSKELPRMAEYYRNAYLTISASTGKCTEPFLISEGLCKEHPDSGIPKDLIPLGLLLSPIFEIVKQQDGGEENVGTRFTKDVIDYVLVRKECPYFLSWEVISQRGWTFQERVLSPRILLFGGRLVWQCHTSQESAGGVTYWDDDVINIDHRTLGRALFKDQQRGNPKDALIDIDSVDKELYGLWYKAVEEYTRRGLSNPSDKLPAISALAQVFQDLMCDRYIAGIWHGDLLRGLMWSTPPTLNVSRPPSWRAPTWSWASHDNEVSYEGIPSPDSVPIARLLVTETAPLSDMAPLGEIAGGTLEIDGPVLEVPKGVTIFLMQAENGLSGVRDTPSWRYQWLKESSSKNFKTDPGCRNWQPPESHIFLALFATPVMHSADPAPQHNVANEVLEATSSQDDAAAARSGNLSTVSSTELPEVVDKSNGLSAISEVHGYRISGLVLGAVDGEDEQAQRRYERLARFTSLGSILIEDYKDLAKLRRKIVIV
jgi:hypothetical protein